MKFSIIIPSFDQHEYISETLENLKILKETAREKNILVELLLFDNCSDKKVQLIIEKYHVVLDYVESKKDLGQYDAINKGIPMVSGDYWTWLNTDDLINVDGFLKINQILELHSEIDYIYGGIKYIDRVGKFITDIQARPLTIKSMVHFNPSIFQPGSFFKTSFTKHIGKLKEYRCCFDYDYVLRCLKNNGVFYQCNFPVASFRYHRDSKTVRMIPVFIKEQLQISADYGRKAFSFLTWFSYLRLLKHKLFPRK